MSGYMESYYSNPGCSGQTYYAGFYRNTSIESCEMRDGYYKQIKHAIFPSSPLQFQFPTNLTTPYVTIYLYTDLLCNTLGNLAILFWQVDKCVHFGNSSAIVSVIDSTITIQLYNSSSTCIGIPRIVNTLIGQCNNGLWALYSVTNQTVTINIVDFTFQPSSVTILRGGCVQWKNLGTTHTVAQVMEPNSTNRIDNGFYSGTIGEVNNYTYCFHTLGTYYYICEVHIAQGMRGSVTVIAETTTSPTTTSTTSLPIIPIASTIVPIPSSIVPTTPILPLGYFNGFNITFYSSMGCIGLILYCRVYQSTTSNTCALLDNYYKHFQIGQFPTSPFNFQFPQEITTLVNRTYIVFYYFLDVGCEVLDTRTPIEYFLEAECIHFTNDSVRVLLGVTGNVTYEVYNNPTCSGFPYGVDITAIGHCSHGIWTITSESKSTPVITTSQPEPIFPTRIIKTSTATTFVPFVYSFLILLLL